MRVHPVRQQLVVVALVMIGIVLGGSLRVERVIAWRSSQAATLVLGQPTFTINGNATEKRLNGPVGVAVDPTSGAVFVADARNNRVLRFGSLASLSNNASAEAVLGQPDFTSNAPSTSAQGMNYPFGVTVDTGGRLWVADASNNRVLRFEAAATKPSGAAADGVLGQPDFVRNVPSTIAQGMNYPHGVAVDAGGRLWVTDVFNNRVLRFEAAATRFNGTPADGVLGQPTFTSNTAATSAQGMHYPFGLAIDAGGRLWVADQINHRILRFDAAATKLNGAAANGVLGQKSFTGKNFAVTAQGMNSPYGVAVDVNGRLWVADTTNNRVLRFEAAASKPNGAAADGVLGQDIFTSRVTATSPQGLRSPQGIAIDTSGQLWVADYWNNRVLRFNSAAAKLNGSGADGILGNSSFLTQWYVGADTLRFPTGAAVDPTTGKVFVADRDNHRVLRFTSLPSLSNGAAAEAVLGQNDFTTSSVSTSPQGMNTPSGVAVDANGRLWVADTLNNRVLRFDAAASKPSGAAADAVLGQSAFTSGVAATSAQGMRQPRGVAIDSSGRLWVAEHWNHRVLRFDAAASKANGAAADGVLGQSTFTSGVAATSAQGMREPQGVAVDASGRLWVADTANNRVLRFDAAASKLNGAAADRVLGQNTFTSSTAATSSWGMSAPYGIAVDVSGRLWVADVSNSRVLWFDAAASKTNGAGADGVLGQSTFTSNIRATSAQGMDYPYGVAVDTNGQLWVADTRNNRVLRFEDAVQPSVTLTPTNASTQTPTWIPSPSATPTVSPTPTEASSSF